jgi:hypothetical protein
MHNSFAKLAALDMPVKPGRSSISQLHPPTTEPVFVRLAYFLIQKKQRGVLF